MSNLRHPNITQFMGVCFLPNCQLPVLLMERLDGSLDGLLETVPNIPLTLKRSILEDVARGLLYLHKHNPQIVHRDLTTKNVLLTSSLVAKITDFGNSRIVNLQPGQLARTLSWSPGTPAYMPPEALTSASCYGPSLDVFSFGHLALFTLTQVFPGDLLEPNYANPINSDPDQLVARSEIERRGEYFEWLEGTMLGGQHPCVQLTKQCLHNIPSRRPTAEQLVATLEGMRADIEGPYGAVARADAVRQVLMMKEICGWEAELRGKTNELTTKDEEIRQLQQQLQHEQDTVARLQRDLGQTIQQKNEEILRITNEFEQHQIETGHTLSEKDAEIEWLRGSLAALYQLSRHHQSTPSELQLPIQLTWKSCQDMPFGMIHYPSAVVIEGKVYVGGGSANSMKSNTVMDYSIQSNDWDILPSYAFFWFSLAVVKSQLVLVGGVDCTARSRTAELGVWDKNEQRWEQGIFPPMLTKRSGPMVVTHSNWLVVGGGFSVESSISTVEILNLSTKEWYTGPQMPIPMYKMSSTVIGNMWYLVGGFCVSSATKVLWVSLDNLIAQTIVCSLDAATMETPWLLLPDVPLVKCVAFVSKGALIAIGGSTFLLYKSSLKSWIPVGKMPDKQRSCTCCTVLPSGEVFIVSGDSRRVDICTLN